ncbi:neurogenic locus notch homolog protein 3-like [Mya arenaria]|uniref:neurogenic locus notch homolog protein 3-like n=1 Tax=Mya arenaria TaxID=6604 RepID=UPI0022E21122|nr:neurogenic locus notch homolog protein 3-like [Mya arenaria]
MSVIGALNIKIICIAIFVGIVIEIMASTSPCSGKPCFVQHPSRCFEIGLKCACNMSGFVGDNCTSDRDECTAGMSDRCSHRGHCFNTVGSFRCECLSGWNGTHCEHSTGEKTACMPGYSGQNCGGVLCKHGYAVERKFNETSPTNKTYKCVCEDGWTKHHEDDSCDTDIDECKLSPCLNGGTCSNTDGSYDCLCIDPWTEKNCSFYDPCKNASCPDATPTCVKKGADDDKNFTCCPKGFTGKNCDEDVNECKDITLCPNATCENTLGSYYCVQNETSTASPPESTVTVTQHVTQQTTQHVTQQTTQHVTQQTTQGATVGDGPEDAGSNIPLIGGAVAGVTVLIALVVTLGVYFKNKAKIKVGSNPVQTDDEHGMTNSNTHFDNTKNR